MFLKLRQKYVGAGWTDLCSANISHFPRDFKSRMIALSFWFLSGAFLFVVLRKYQYIIVCNFHKFSLVILFSATVLALDTQLHTYYYFLFLINIFYVSRFQICSRFQNLISTYKQPFTKIQFSLKEDLLHVSFWFM